MPVIVVGNFTAGGTGKTPLVIALARELSARGWRPGIVSAATAGGQPSPVRVGVETRRLGSAATSRADVRAHRRCRCSWTAIASPPRAQRIAAGCDVVIADDGLQHRRLGRDLEIEVVDGERGYGNGLLLPAGPCASGRVPATSAWSTAAAQASAGDWPMQLRLRDAVSLVGRRGARRRCAHFAGAPVHAVAGIGNPERFFDALRDAGLELRRACVRDHHGFVARRLRRPAGADPDDREGRGKMPRTRACATPGSCRCEAELPDRILRRRPIPPGAHCMTDA